MSKEHRDMYWGDKDVLHHRLVINSRRRVTDPDMIELLDSWIADMVEFGFLKAEGV